MPVLVLFLVTVVSPKVQDPETILHKFDNFAFKDTNLSVKNLNTVEITRKLLTEKRFQVQSQSQWNIYNGQHKEELQAAWRFR